ncbi:hypothetical protein SISNIDRAFT_467712 [Sistotremastrum niveocremeum HHB9708]|uniref:Uncharacterized protein n=1 Tax=Sistotremastrum niveocremeum HHB9708 TaxID=1314777 RepID=A0A164SH02_9AGAM|nr:hypothetical protein SISNIDRAFT_467712 [Sistotremastrum niveocremeum HHB9708]
MSTANRPVLLTLQIVGGHVGLPVLLVTFLFVKRKRSIVVIHFCISWIVFSVAGSLLQQMTVPQLCKPSLSIARKLTLKTGRTALATLSLLLNRQRYDACVVQLYFCLTRPSWFVKSNSKRWVEKTLAYTPYFGFGIFFFQTYAWSAPVSGEVATSTFNAQFCTTKGNIWVPSYFLAIGVLGVATLLDGSVASARYASFFVSSSDTGLIAQLNGYRAVYLVMYIIMTIESGQSLHGNAERALQTLGITVQYVQAATALVAFLVLATKSVGIFAHSVKDVLAVWGIRVPDRWRTHYASCENARAMKAGASCICDTVDQRQEIDEEQASESVRPRGNMEEVATLGEESERTRVNGIN